MTNNQQDKAVYYYSESKQDFVDVMEMEPHHARHALRKLLRNGEASQKAYNEGWNDAMDRIAMECRTNRRY